MDIDRSTPKALVISDFTCKVFEDLQIEYPKNPVIFAKIDHQLRHDADAPETSEADRIDSRQNLCLLDLAVASFKVKTGDNQEAKIMLDDAKDYLKKLDKVTDDKTTRTIHKIADYVEKKVAAGK